MMEDSGIDAHQVDTSRVEEDDDAMVTATDLDNKSSALEQENTTQFENKESSLSPKDSPLVADKMHCQDYDNFVHPTPQDEHQPKPVNDCYLADQSLMEPGVDVAEITGDANTPIDTIDGSHRDCGSTDGATLDAKNQSVCTLPTDEFLEANKLVENGTEVNNVETALESPTHSGTKEEELSNGITLDEPHLDNDIKVKGINEGVNRVEFLPHNKTEEEELDERMTGMEQLIDNEAKEELSRQEFDLEQEVDLKPPQNSFLLEPYDVGGDESGTEMEQVSFMKELETFCKESCLEFKPPKFYGEPLNCLKLWRAVIRLGGYEQVTSCKLWRQVGESFKPPKTCTTVSWTFRCFYEKALLEYERYKMRIGELPFTDASLTEPVAAGNQVSVNQASGSGRARRDAAARAMQGWHSQRLLSNGEVGDPIIKDKNASSLRKREKQLKSIGLLKRKKPSPVERAVKVARMKASKTQLGSMVVDVGPPADWVKINVQRTKDCFEVYALVPGLLREEVRVQSDPAGRLVISGQPEQQDNHWGVTPFKKVVSLPSRIDPHQTSAVVTLHGQLFVRVPFEQPDL